MDKHGIKLLLIHIDEAHSSDTWPVGLKDAPLSHANIDERISRAKQFYDNEYPPFTTYIDTWSNSYAEIFRAWPDKYYCIDSNLQIEYMSEYGKVGKNNALIIKDCTKLIEEMMA